MRNLLLILVLCHLTTGATAGSCDTAAFKSLNLQRIHTTRTGMTILASWGTANLVAGIAGTISAKEEEAKRFHQMNAIWGAVNMGIAAAGLIGTRKELRSTYSYTDALRHHEGIKRLFLINAGLDVLYISTGAFLIEHSRNANTDAPIYTGYGRSLLLQGAGLLIFDISMFTAHAHSDKVWYKALQGLCITGSGLSYSYAFR